MALLEPLGNTNYWGLVQQKGPWKSVPIDKKRARDSLKNDPILGGGNAVGDTKHAGHG